MTTDPSASLGRALNSALAERALQYASPETIPYVRRSVYLADALRELQQSGAQNIRTPFALGTNLLADFLLEKGSRKADADLTERSKADQARIADMATLGLPTPGSAPPAAEAGPAGEAGGAPPAAAPPALPQPAPGPAAQLSPADRDALVRAVWGEARGEPTEGRQAVADVVLNRSHMAGKSPADIVAEPHQFSGYGQAALNVPANSSIYQSILRDLAPVLDGSAPDVTHGADHFYNPHLASPSWGGPGQDIGNHRFLSIGYGGQGAVSPSATDQAMPADAQIPPQGGPPPQAPPPQGMPPQAPGPSPFAQNPAPTTPTSAANSPPPGPALAGGAPYSEPPHGLPPTSGEWQRVQMLLHSGNPAMIDQGIHEAQALQQRFRSPEAPPGPEYRWDTAKGRYVAKAPFEDVQGGAPNSYVQRGPDGQLHVTANPAYGALPQGTQLTPGNEITPVRGGQPQVVAGEPYGFPKGTLVQKMPDGKMEVVQKPEYDPSALAEVRNSVLKSPEYSNAIESTNAYKAMTDLAKQAPGGMRAYALRDTFARVINPGAVARVGTIQAIRESQGIPASIQAFFMNLKGDGDVPPQIVQQILNAAHPFASANWTAADRLNQGNAGYASRHNLDPRDVTAPMPDAPRPFHVPAPQPAPAASAGGHSQEDVAAAEALLRKRGYREVNGQWVPPGK